MLNYDMEDLNDYKKSKAYSYFERGWLGKIDFHPLKDTPFCLMRTDCRPSQRLSDPLHKLWLLLSKDTGNVLEAHCSCMAGMKSTCNHVAAALFRIEAAMRYGLSNPSSTSLPNEWLPNRSEVQPSKAKDIDFNRDDFTKRDKKPKKLLSTPKKTFRPLEYTRKKKPTSFENIVKSLEDNDLLKNTTLSTAIPKPEIDFMIENVKTKNVEAAETLPCIDDVTLTSNSVQEFMENVTKDLTPEVIDKIESATKGQSTNELWFQHRKGVITASKAHEVKTKMKTIENYPNGSEKSEILMWSLTKKVAGFSFVNPNIPA